MILSSERKTITYHLLSIGDLASVWAISLPLFFQKHFQWASDLMSLQSDEETNDIEVVWDAVYMSIRMQCISWNELRKANIHEDRACHYARISSTQPEKPRMPFVPSVKADEKSARKGQTGEDVLTPFNQSLTFLSSRSSLRAEDISMSSIKTLLRNDVPVASR